MPSAPSSSPPIHRTVSLELLQVQLVQHTHALPTGHLETVNTCTFKVVSICCFNLCRINAHLQGKQQRAVMKSSANTGKLTRTATVLPLTSNYTDTSLFPPDAWHIFYGPDRVDSTSADKHAQTMKFTNRRCRVHTPIPPLEPWQSDSWWDRLFWVSWNTDSRTHMKQLCSLVSRGTLRSRQCMQCVYV